MKRFLFLMPILLFFQVALAQSNEYYVQITIGERTDLEILTRLVSIDNVQGTIVLAYANDNEFAALKKSGFSFQELPHPSSDPGKVINMATTVAQMASWDRYPTYDVYVQMMQNWATNYPEICKLDTIGNSVQGRMLLALKISDNAHQSEAEPQILMTSTMHGDETTGMILMMRLIDYLLTNYGTLDRATTMVNSMELYISPNTNPDGTYYGGNQTVANSRRANYNGVDINRDFPDPRIGANAPYAIETQLMMNYASTHKFVFGANFHGGIELVNYPWDAWTSAQNPHADNSWWAAVSRQYATLAQNNSPSGYFTGQNNGITHGGDWYVVSGGRQDYMNYFHNCREVTLEVSNTKLLSTDQLVAHWNYNREAMLTYMENIYFGIQGFVKNTNEEPLNATITVVGHDKDNSHVVTNPSHGNYYRMIMPGTYTLKFEAYGYIPQTITGVVVTANTITPLNVTLQQASVVTLAGTVLSGSSGLPLEGVTVTIQGTPIAPATTNTQGQFQIPGIMEGEYPVRFVKSGYMSKTVTMNISQSMEAPLVLMELFTGFSFEDGVVPANFSFTGNQPWSIVSGVAYDGDKSMKSGAIGHSQSTTMSYTFTTQSSGDVTFYAKVSSEANYDKLTFFINNVSQGVWSGNIDWTLRTYPVAAGTHTLKWTYSKDGSAIGGLDAAWVDFIAVPGATTTNPIPYITPRSVVHQTYNETSNLDLEIRNVGQGTLNYSATVEDAGQHTWISLENQTGALAHNQQGLIALNFNFAGLNCAQYNANILIDVVDSVITIPVTADYLVGVDSNNKPEFSIYPNPAKNQVHFVFHNFTENTTLTVYSISGVKISENKILSENSAFATRDLGINTQGVYLIRIQTATTTYQQKLVVQ
jgi:hypothetical protein